MTAIPDHIDRFAQRRNEAPMRGPKVEEHFWGLEIASSQRGFDSAMILRVGFGIASIGLFWAAFMVWTLPLTGFIYGPVAAKIMLSVLLLAAGSPLARVACRRTDVFVQLDSNAGELREVVYTVFGEAVILARYGFDSVTDVTIQRSSRSFDVAQIHIEVDGKGRIPAGTGHALRLDPLRNKMLVELGLSGGRSPRPAIWSGPLAA